MSWPNRITIARILLIPLLVMTAIRSDQGERYRYFTLWIFLGLSLTDALDGFLARALKQRTQLGTFLDPLADKLLLTTATILLVCPIWLDPATGQLTRLLPVSIAVVTISRDLLLAIGALIVFMMTGDLKVRPSAIGKITTFAQIAMVVAALLPPLAALRRGVFWTAAALTLASLVGYTIDWCRQMSILGEPDRPEKKG